MTACIASSPTVVPMISRPHWRRTSAKHYHAPGAAASARSEKLAISPASRTGASKRLGSRGGADLNLRVTISAHRLRAWERTQIGRIERVVDDPDEHARDDDRLVDRAADPHRPALRVHPLVTAHRADDGAEQRRLHERPDHVDRVEAVRTCLEVASDGRRNLEV